MKKFDLHVLEVVEVPRLAKLPHKLPPVSLAFTDLATSSKSSAPGFTYTL